MKTFDRRSLGVAAAVAVLAFCVACAPAYAHKRRHGAYAYGGVYASPVGVFAELQYYGTWVYVPPFGYCWRPWVVIGWRPYLHGHWIWTRYGWFWVSYEPFGWIVYHYGRWFLHPVYGWLWVPDYTWGPAWVQWVVVGTYIGWAPLPPPGWDVPPPGPYGGYYGEDDDDYDDARPYPGPYGYRPQPGPARPRFSANVWVFVSVQEFTRDNVAQYVRTPALPRDSNLRVERRAPDVREVERWAGRPVRPVPLEWTRVDEGRPSVVQPRLPREEERRVESYRPMVEREVLQPREKPPFRPKDSDER
jgi:hypothetical protein